MTIMSCEFESHFLHEEKIFAEIAQLVEHNLAKVRVASSSLVFRSTMRESMISWFPFFYVSFSEPLFWEWSIIYIFVHCL